MSVRCLLFIVSIFTTVVVTMLVYKPLGASNQYGYWIPQIQFYQPIFSVPTWKFPEAQSRSPPKNLKNRQRVPNQWVKVAADNATDETPCPPTHLRNFVSVSQRNGEDSIRVLQYNVLAETYNTPDRYSYCPGWALKWNYRGRNIVNEMLAYQPDIITLQEVDMYEWFEQQLSKYGFKGIYRQRPKGKPDGVAIFYNTSRIRVLNLHNVNYNSLEPLPAVKAYDTQRYQKNNIALFALIETIPTDETATSRRFVVATTHTYWDPQLSDLKLRQAHMLLQELKRYVDTMGDGLNTPVIISGDFNSMPNSAMYELYSRGVVSGSHAEMLEFSSTEDFKHDFTLSSAYSHLKEPLSNFTPWFKGCLDYVWYSNQLEMHSILEPLSEEQMAKDTALPSTSWSSDHTCLCCDLQFKPQQ